MSRHPGSFDIRAAGQFVVLACPFPAIFFFITVETGNHFCPGLQGVQVQNLCIDRVYGRTAVVHIEIIPFHIKSRVPVRPDFLHRFPLARFRCSRTVQHAFSMCRTDIIEMVFMYKKPRCIIFYRQHGIGDEDMFPIRKILGIPVAGRLRGKQVIFVFKRHHNRVGSFANPLTSIYFHKPVVEVDRVTKGFRRLGNLCLYRMSILATDQ